MHPGLGTADALPQLPLGEARDVSIYTDRRICFSSHGVERLTPEELKMLIESYIYLWTNRRNIGGHIHTEFQELTREGGLKVSLDVSLEPFSEGSFSSTNHYPHILFESRKKMIRDFGSCCVREIHIRPSFPFRP